MVVVSEQHARLKLGCRHSGRTSDREQPVRPGQEVLVVVGVEQQDRITPDLVGDRGGVLLLELLDPSRLHQLVERAATGAQQVGDCRGLREAHPLQAGLTGAVVGVAQQGAHRYNPVLALEGVPELAIPPLHLDQSRLRFGGELGRDVGQALGGGSRVDVKKLGRVEPFDHSGRVGIGQRVEHLGGA